ncbi:hypothetical protein HK101_003158 [Irineochytrium annulatum]|nr:hypothetical protein HK101_003158 [Irineochytrium annulatum]
MGITIIKYTPQAYMNFQRKSTAGWSIHNILLDFTGGFLSFLQQGIDSSANNDWSGIWGNPVKLGLGLFSMGFDVLFMVQHYVLYPEKGRTDEEALLAGGRDD